MITLQRLRADHFKGLHQIDITFPAVGSMLIEGHNEAGKSTLFEAIYVALYGRGLVGENDKQPRQEDLIAFDEASGWVELTFAVGTTQAKVSRRFTRGKAQEAHITVTRPGAADETRHGISAVNERVVREIGGLDGDTLRNSCFVEQKEVGRLESLSRSEREIAIERLLGLGRFSQLDKRFRETQRTAEEAAKRARDQLAIARAQATAQAQSARATTARDDLAAARAAQLLAELASQVAEQDRLAAEAATNTHDLQHTQAHLDRAAYLAEEIRALETRLATAQQTLAQSRTYADDTLTARQDLAAQATQLAQAEAAANAANAQENAAEKREALTAWGQIAAAADHLRGYAAQEAETQQARDQAHQTLAQARRAQRRANIVALGLGVPILAAIAWGIVTSALWAGLVAGALVILAVALQIPAQRRTQAAKNSAASSDVAWQTARLQSETAHKASGIAPEQLAALRAQLRALGIAHDPTAAEAETLRQSVSDTPPVAIARQQARDALSALSAARVAHDAARQRLADLQAHAPVAISTEDLQTWAGQLSQLQAEQQGLHPSLLTGERDRLLAAQGQLQAQLTQVAQQQTIIKEALRTLCTQQGITLPDGQDLSPALILAAWPRVGQVQATAYPTLAEAAEVAAKNQQEAQAMAQAQVALRQGTADSAPLDPDECAARLAQAERQVIIAERAQAIITEARGRVMRQVLPATERNMCVILPQLTAGRYHDVRLTPPDDADGTLGDLDYRIRVWDPTARRYVGKSIFSGGARDQCSLALRLAFALATLPQELGIAPGFLFLDEPLSAFDNERAGALVELLTTGLIAHAFAQVIVISHQHAYAQSDFRYHVRMERGRVVTSDLPVQEAIHAQPMVAR
jgi:DNA repair exonuclease SbcCD ATPase subunit